MERQDIEDLIARRVAEAKLEVVSKRLELILWIGSAMLAFFGIVLPMWQLSQSSDKLDAAIKEFRNELSTYRQSFQSDFKELSKAQASQTDASTQRINNGLEQVQKQFKDLAGTQMRRPLLELYYGGSSLEGAIIPFSQSQQGQSITLKNIGDFPAKNIRIRFYINSVEGQDPWFNELQWSYQSISDESAFNKMFEVHFSVPLDPKESKLFELQFPADWKRDKFPCLIKVFYEQPDPKKYSFTIISK